MDKFLFLLLFPILVLSQPKLDQVDALFMQKDFNKAELLLVNYLNEYPNNVSVIELLGDAYSHQKKWDDAVSNYKKLVAFNNNNANYQYKYGGALGMKAQAASKLKALTLIGDVKAAFLKAAQLDPSHLEVRWALVELYMQLPGILGGSKETALLYSDELQNLSKVDGYLAKGYVFEYDEEPGLAEKYYKMAIQEGGSLTCFEKLTSFYENKNQPENAIETIQEAQKKHQRNALHYQIGKVAAEYNIELKKGEQCLKIYLENYSVEDGVPKAWAHYRLAQIHLHRSNKSEALKYIDLAIAELPMVTPFKEQKEKILSL